MHFVRIETSDDDTRWINLAQVVRVTMAYEVPSGDPLLVITSGPEESDRFTLRGDNDKDRQTIEKLITLLDEMSHKP